MPLVRRLILPVVLLLAGLLMQVPTVRVIAVLVGSGTPDATAVSVNGTFLVQAIAGAVLLAAGLMLLVLRRRM